MQSNNHKIKKKDSIISKQQHIIEEFSENGEIQYNCTVCRKTFRSRSQKYYHLNCNQLQNLIYQCEHCDKSFVRKSQWKYHNESHLSPINECRKCQKTFSNPLALKKHLSLHKVEPKLCPHCNKSFKKKLSLEQHIAAQHLNQLQYGCALCTKKYASKSTLQLHLQSHDKKRFECTFCGKQFQRNSILKLHLKRHNNTNVICNICQKVFSESGALARHRKIHEEKVVQYHCKLCDKNILRKDNMTRHLNTIHPDEKFDNIVVIIQPEMANTNINPNNITIEKNVSNNDINTLKEKHKNEKKNVVIIENKLLQKPFELKDCIIELPKNTIQKLTTPNCTEEYPLMNQIKVITANCTYEKDIVYDNNENASHNFLLPSINHHQKVDSNILQQSETSLDNSATERNCNLNLIQRNENDVADISINNQSSTNLNKYQNQTEEQTLIQNSCNNNHEPPKTQTISSVIRSVGNVKNLTCHFDPPPPKTLNQTCSEYKHKKYCRNNYNIDLYRKILGCDEDDEDNEHEQKEQQSQEDLCDNHLLKSSNAAAVHWRKSFKNNYETWST